MSKENVQKNTNKKSAPERSKEAVDLTLSRINNIDSQKEFLTKLCRSMMKDELPQTLQDAIVNDVDIHFYDKNKSVRLAFQQGTQISVLSDAVVSNFEYAMKHLVPYYKRVLFLHAKIDKMNCVYSIVWKEYSKTIMYEIMIDHSSGFHKQVPYQLYKSIHPLEEIKKIDLTKTSTIEKIGWLSETQVLESCKRKMQPLLLNTPFSTHLITNGQVFFHKNKKSDAIGKSKKCFLNVCDGVSKGMTIYIGAIIRQTALPHAWLVNEDFKVLELTPRNEGLQVYFGVPVNKKEYKRLFKKSENMLDVYMLKDFESTELRVNEMVRE